MALAPIQFISDFMEDYPNYWLKLYEQGTTTPIVMATNKTGTPTVAKAEISAGPTPPLGLIKTAGNVTFIPYVDEAYDAYIFPTAAEADANDTSNAIQLADDVDFLQILPNQVGGVLVAAVVANTSLVIGDFVDTVGHQSNGDDGDNQYEIVAGGTGTADNGSFINLDNGLQAKGLFPKGVINLDQFGTDGTRAGDSIAIRAAIVFAAGSPVRLQDKRYFYDGTVIAETDVRVYGNSMPQVNSGKTALENGSIIDGSFPFTCDNADFRDFGVDVGSASAAAEADALRVSATTLNAGGHLHTENIVGLCKTASVPRHALLFQSFQKHTGDNLLGVFGNFGFVSKCQNVNLGLINTIENDESGVLLKSDIAFGICRDVSIQRVICDCNAAQKRGFHIQSSDAGLRDVQIGHVKSDGAEENVLLQCGASGVELRNISIDTILSKNSQSKDLGIDTGSSSIAPIFNVNIGSVVTEGTQVFGLRVEGNGDTDDLNIESLFINYEASATQGTMDASCFIGTNTSKSRIDDLSIILNFTTAKIGGITYNNTGDVNVLGSRIATVFGVGSPNNGVSEPALTGTGNTLTIPANQAGDGYSFVRPAPTAGGVEVNEFAPPVASAKDFAKGHRLTILNNSVFSMDILHNPTSGIYNKGAATVTIPQNEAVTWVFGGSDVWSES